MEFVNCAICGNDNTRVLAKKGIFEKGGPIISFTNVICKNCGLVYINPRPIENELEIMYKKFYLSERHRITTKEESAAFLEKVNSKNKGEQILDVISDYLKPGNRILDIGAGLGIIMAHLRDGGSFDVHGIEPSVESVQAAKNFYKLENIFQGTIDEYIAKHPNEKFHCIILHHVFEHFSAPMEKLTQLNKMLYPSGILYIEVPNILQFKKPTDQFFDYCHYYNYSLETLQQILKMRQFKIIKWNKNKKNRLQIIATPNQSTYEEISRPINQSAIEFKRIIWYCRKRRLFDFLYNLIMILRKPTRLFMK